MTGKELYNKITAGEEVTSWQDLPGLVKRFYNDQASARCVKEEPMDMYPNMDIE